MKKSSIALSLVAALCTSSFGAKLNHDDLQAQIEALKAQIALLEQKVNQANEKPSELKLSEVTEKRIEKIEKKVATNYKKINEVKTHDANDNIKWDIDFRTQMDNISYKLSNGTKAKNDALMTNRLWLGMGYSPNDNTIFKGTLSYNKAYGDSANHSQANTNPGYANFDWVTNENANDNTIKVKEAYWLYKNDSFMGNEKLPWTISVGRRPSTDGLGINVRADQERKSALSHTVNVEFDGLSARFDLDKITGVEGMWWKFCAGRGLTNAKARFSADGLDYANDDTKNPNIDMAGFIFVPYDNGQYSIHTNYAKAWNMIGFTQSDLFDGNNSNNTFKDSGDLELATIMFKVDGIGNEISDYLDNTNAFVSFAMSKTHPNSLGMLGSTESKTGNSIWLGINAPCPLDKEDSRIGIEWNKGSKYWRPMTYGEDTMVGSKIAARGTAWEIYRNSKINNALSWSLRYTKIDYDYAGSNSFFGYDGNPDLGLVSPYVTEAENITANIRYRF
ncbi:DUF3373 family protein [Arcobacter sp.]|uniref:DUF3373 family protein n=1 Tax=Arcobacter sp. TaxID=1872629 RepID=UPI003D0C65AD